MAKECLQKAGIIFDETFSPVTWFDTVRTMLSIAANEGLELAQFDVKTAFLNEEIEEEIYRKQPDGYGDGTTIVCRLFKITNGSAECCLGMKIMKTNDGSIFVHQEKYTLRMLSKFRMADAKHVQSPLERENSDTNESCVKSVPISDKIPYREAVGSLMFLARFIVLCKCCCREYGETN